MFSDAVRINYDSIVAVLVINCDQVSTPAPLPLCRLVPGVQTAEIAATDGWAGHRYKARVGVKPSTILASVSPVKLQPQLMWENSYCCSAAGLLGYNASNDPGNPEQGHIDNCAPPHPYMSKYWSFSSRYSKIQRFKEWFWTSSFYQSYSLHLPLLWAIPYHTHTNLTSLHTNTWILLWPSISIDM